MHDVDVVIIGGGVAGLWAQRRLIDSGFSVALVERTALGSGQTVGSQGIIHGGTKYSLGGEASRASSMIAPMPELWRSCLRGEGPVDLSRVEVLSRHQHLWTTGSLGSRLTGLAASKVIRTATHKLARHECPEAFTGAPSDTDIYAVDEQVIEPRSLVEALRTGREVRGQAHVEFSGEGVRVRVRGEGTELGLHAGAIVVCAGAGAASVLQELGLGGELEMQERPLHMVMARVDVPTMFAHCVGTASDRPRVTITTGRARDGSRVWSIGGEIAESGVGRDRDEQVAACRRELDAVLPWLDLGGLEYATWRVSRAEGRTAGGKRPEGPIVRRSGRVIACWPTKLAFAPACADRIAELLSEAGVTPSGHAVELPGWPAAEVAELPWDAEGVRWS